MKIQPIVVALALLRICAQSQSTTATPQPAARHDSVTVSANIPKKQLDLEKQLDGALNEAEKHGSERDFDAALKGFKRALEMVRSEPLLKESEDRVLVKVSRAYVEAKQFEEAVRSYTTLVELRKVDCKPGADELERCAEAQYDLGLAYMYKGDFQAALPILRESVANYGSEAAGGHFEEYKMIKLKQQAEGQILLAAALFRTGSKRDALATLDSAIKQLDTVQRNENIQPSIRESARNGLKQAQQNLEAIKRN